ncbi:hypothetical protein [Thermomonospora cellulosilytica]|uniref:Secreted protein n=1 Tax=Thermomonospora cellulosilytica TaxID=1411118 RepID=A0A7W3RA49_9ACTN|nr:hypothetical protein [Thermomonospora cellulosilytica]MBA9005476.1 hypothetical protein [Thermomonospora cellulosilytica]
MSTALMVVIAVVVVAVLAAAGFLLWSRLRTQRLRRQFGPEYDRALERHGSRGAAERELLARRQRHRQLDLRPLDPVQRERYREQWTHVQERFVDTPEEAVEHADRLVTTVMAERGYPTEDFEERIAHLSVEHGRTLDQYRRGREISRRAADGTASTEELRQAMVHYRALFEELLAVPEEEGRTGPGDGADRTDKAGGTGQADKVTVPREARRDGSEEPRS